MLKDMMPHFDLYQPDTVDAAVTLVKQLGGDGWVVAGGQDSFDWLKNRVKRTPAVVDISGIAELRGVTDNNGGVTIGALTTLAEIEAHPLIRERFGLLATAAGRVASPQIRNVGTLGGNLLQDTRCWYYRGGMDCYRAGGNMCYADTPQGQNREHAVFGASRCVAVTPSDTANALVALEASFVLRGASGERIVPAADFFVGPAVDIRRMNALREGELLVAVNIPATWAGAEFYFEKVADRAAWDFALVSIAMALRTEGGTIRDARVVCGAVACTPLRLTAVEQALSGGARDAATADRVAPLASRGAQPLGFNGFKIPLMENLVRRAVRGGQA
ncbi:MAG: xanthine dehydrogenase family protein subunit M [Nevskiaceae bacterium]|jgi:xanthine dehydrogenase YagS FAD-binding subunit|nr:xanthine dehydrogenase family protein subunit M [Nevskiaceae bacterium]